MSKPASESIDHRPRVLIADDQTDVREALRLLLKGSYELELVASPTAILERVRAVSFDAILMDLNYTRDTTSGNEGISLIPRILSYDHEVPVIVMTAWGSVEGAVQAMRSGARDYVQKPWDNARLTATLANQIALRRSLREGARLRAQSQRERDTRLPVFISESKPMKDLRELLDKFAASDANVLITGEHGTGKEVVARWVHARSTRKDAAFVPIDAGSFPDGVFESELFGHVKGAFTDARDDRPGCFELADGGSLFFDEIGNMPSGQQAKLLRVLQQREVKRVGASRTIPVDVRIISATNANLHDSGFRKDLLYRLNTLHLHVPPLRERPADIVALADHALGKCALKYGKAELGFSKAAIACMQSHPWPGNVRQLEHAVERAVIVCSGSEILPMDLGLSDDNDPSTGTMTLAELESWAIARAIDRAQGNVGKAAEALGLSRSALYRRLQQQGQTDEGTG